jgi:4-hydroxy-tetrahydrodipicolinate reductase
MIRVCLAGATGAVGRALVPAIQRSKDMRLVGAVSRSQKGRGLGEVLGIPRLSLVISGSVKEALRNDADVLVDFTSPAVVKSNVIQAIENSVHVVIGTSGLTYDDFAEIDQLARKRKVGVLAGGNFAVSAVLMQHFALTAAKVMPSWEIVEYASEAKPDAPSGTSRELAYSLSKVRSPRVKIPIGRTLGQKESRGASMRGSQVHSVRLPGFVSRVDVIFGDESERLIITHEAAADQRPYVRGVLMSVRKVSSWVGLKQGLWEIMNLPGS